jgi:leucyl-tRNA synthetase
MELGIQVNGKLRTRMTVPAEISKEDLQELMLNNPELSPWIEGKTLKKFIAIKNIVNVVMV